MKTLYQKLIMYFDHYEIAINSSGEFFYPRNGRKYNFIDGYMMPMQLSIVTIPADPKAVIKGWVIEDSKDIK